MAGSNTAGFKKEADRKILRRKRRIRNQIISYVVAGIVLAGTVTGAAIGIHRGLSAMNEKKREEEQLALEGELDAQQEPQVIEAPMETQQTETETTKSPLDEIVDNSIAEMPLEDKVAGLFIITPEALTGTDVAVKAGDTTREKLRDYPVGGLVYFSQNMQSGEQLEEMLSNTIGYSSYPLFIAVDEEGGTVSRVAESGLAENVGDMADIGAAGDTAMAKEAGSNIAAYLSEYGFNLDFAPVADVVQDGNTTIGNRSFGSNAGLVAGMVAANVDGLQESGISACLKHFPGLGSTTEDTHEGMVSSDRTLEDFDASDFLSFRAGIDAGAEFVMVSHLSVPNITGDNTPSSLSEKMITEILRGELGFEGVVITDAMNMRAVTEYYTSAEAAVKALQAGADMILMPEEFEMAYNGVIDAVKNGILSEERIDESLRRIYRVKQKDRVQS